MLAKVLSSAVLGVDAYLVDVEVDIALGLPTFNTVGLPDVAVKESRDRVKAAIKNSGFEFPAKRITVNLAPADIKKEGVAFDLPTAVGILAALELVRPDRLARLAIRYILCNPAITAPIPGLITVEQVDNMALAIAERRELDQQERADLKRAMDRAWANLPSQYQWLKNWEYV